MSDLFAVIIRGESLDQFGGIDHACHSVSSAPSILPILFFYNEYDNISNIDSTCSIAFQRNIDSAWSSSCLGTSERVTHLRIDSLDPKTSHRIRFYLSSMFFLSLSLSRFQFGGSSSSSSSTRSLRFNSFVFFLKGSELTYTQNSIRTQTVVISFLFSPLGSFLMKNKCPMNVLSLLHLTHSSIANWIEWCRHEICPPLPDFDHITSLLFPLPLPLPLSCLWPVDQ